MLNPFKKLSKSTQKPTFNNLPLVLLDKVTSYLPLKSVGSPTELEHLLQYANGRKLNISIDEKSLKNYIPNDYFKIILKEGGDGVARLKTTLKSGFTGTDVMPNPTNFNIKDFATLFQLSLSALELDFIVKTNTDLKYYVDLLRIFEENENGLQELKLTLYDTDFSSLDLSLLLSQVSTLKTLDGLHLHFKLGKDQTFAVKPSRSGVSDLTLDLAGYSILATVPFLRGTPHLKSFHVTNEEPIESQEALQVLEILSKKPKLRELYWDVQPFDQRVENRLLVLCSRLDKIHLTNTQDPAELFRLLETNSRVTEVQLKFGVINNDASVALGRFLRNTNTLKVLVLDDLLFNANNVEWAQGLSENKSLKEVGLNFNSFSENQLEHYYEFREKNPLGMLEMYNSTMVPFKWNVKKTSR